MSKKGGHHGGAWKVAFADFVTAMMALFLVLWLTSQDQKVKEAVQRSFRRSGLSLTKEGGSVIPGTARAVQKNTSTRESSNSPSVKDMETLKQIGEELEKAMNENPEASENGVMMVELTAEGLNINVFDRPKKPIFDGNSDKLTEFGRWVFSTVAWAISRYPRYPIDLAGHTERGLPAIRENYTKWELSTDRANATRRILSKHGVPETEMHKVSGLADTSPLANRDPTDESNRRVTVLLKIPTQAR